MEEYILHQAPDFIKQNYLENGTYIPSQFNGIAHFHAHYGENLATDIVKIQHRFSKKAKIRGK